MVCCDTWLQFLAGLHEGFMLITISQVTKGSIVVYFGVDQQTDTSLEDVLARLEVRILLLIG